MKIVSVIPLQRGILKADLTYFTARDVENGSVVEIPVRNKKILGLVVSVRDAAENKSGVKGMPFGLKKIIEVKKHSIFKNEFLDSAFKLGDYFVSSKSNAVSSLIPTMFREQYDKLAEFQNNETGNSGTSSEIKSEKLLLQAGFEDRISFYKTLIRGQFALKKSVFIILPTGYDIDIFYQSLSKGIENFVFHLHGGLKPRKILEEYKKIMNSPHGVLVLGTAQFLSIPRSDIEVIVVEHESSSAYKMIPKPHFDLRIFTEIYASKIGAKFILGDTLLRYETIARKETDGLGEIYPMSFRINFDKVEIEVTNPNVGANSLGSPTPKFRILGERVVKEIENALEKEENVFVFSLRKGLATYTLCKDCGETVGCEKCRAPVVLYLSRDGKKRMFACNKCNTEKNPETVCANCGSWNLIPLGIGADAVFEEIKKKFSKAKIFRLDRESIKTQKEAEKTAEEFEKSKGSILVGTEMAFYYLQEKTALSVIASFDSLWSIPNFRMSEKIIQLLFHIISKTEKKIIIQTKNEKDPALSAVQSENLLSFVRAELEDRKKLNYPPFRRFVKITYLGDKAGAIEAEKTLGRIFREYNPEIFSGWTAKNRNKYSANALIRLETKKWSLPEISAGSLIDERLKNLLASLPPAYEISVDPEDLL